MTRANTTPHAYVLRYRNGYNEPCAVVYALTAKAARQQFGRIDGASYISTEADRREELDVYAPSGPTVTDLLTRHSWHFECHACAEFVTRERHPEAIVEGEDPDVPKVYCNATCKAARP